MSTNFVNKAIEVVKKATAADRSKDYEQALQLYVLALQYFVTALKYEKNQSMKITIAKKTDEYTARAEQLKKFLDCSQKSTSCSNSGTAQAENDQKSTSDDKAKMNASLRDAIVKEKPNVRWDDIAGLQAAKETLKEVVVLPLRFPKLFKGNRKPWSGILLYGPPGTGKSYLAKAVATECMSTFFSISSADLMTKWVGESEKLVRQMFEVARENKPSIIFIDEIDSICGSRSDNDNEVSRRVKTEFLVQMNGVGTNNDGVLVMAATNLPWQLDQAVRRRFEKRVYIPLPDTSARARMIHIHLGSIPHSLSAADCRIIGEQTNGYSGSDLSILVRDAMMQPVRAIQTATHFKKVRGPDCKDEESSAKDFLTPCSPGDVDAMEMDWSQVDPDKLIDPVVTLSDFQRSLKSSKSSVATTDLQLYIEWTTQFGQDG
jgi:vacuolar protein-sorting-associated protein 4